MSNERTGSKRQMAIEQELFNDPEVWEGAGVPRLLIMDLRAIAHVELDKIKAFSEALAKIENIVSVEKIESLAREHASAKARKSIARSVVNLSADGIEQIVAGVNKWRHSNEKRLQLLPDELMERVGTNLDALLQEYPALALMQKANALSRESGNEIDSILYLCDLRGVYSEDRQSLVGFVPLVTLKLGFTKQNGDEDIVEFVLNENELEWMRDKSSQALEKLQVMQRTIGAMAIRSESE